MASVDNKISFTLYGDQPAILSALRDAAGKNFVSAEQLKKNAPDGSPATKVTLTDINRGEACEIQEIFDNIHLSWQLTELGIDVRALMAGDMSEEQIADINKQVDKIDKSLEARINFWTNYTGGANLADAYGFFEAACPDQPPVDASNSSSQQEDPAVTALRAYADHNIGAALATWIVPSAESSTDEGDTGGFGIAAMSLEDILSLTDDEVSELSLDEISSVVDGIKQYLASEESKAQMGEYSDTGNIGDVTAQFGSKKSDINSIRAKLDNLKAAVNTADGSESERTALKEEIGQRKSGNHGATGLYAELDTLQGIAQTGYNQLKAKYDEKQRQAEAAQQEAAKQRDAANKHKGSPASKASK